LLKHRWRRWQCARIERRIGKLYGLGRIALDPNLSALLRKVDQTVDTFADRDTTQS
jgi:hypothetical protein